MRYLRQKLTLTEISIFLFKHVRENECAITVVVLICTYEQKSNSFFLLNAPGPEIPRDTGLDKLLITKLYTIFYTFFY